MNFSQTLTKNEKLPKSRVKNARESKKWNSRKNLKELEQNLQKLYKNPTKFVKNKKIRKSGTKFKK